MLKQNTKPFWFGWILTLIGAACLVGTLTARGLQPEHPRLPLSSLFEIVCLVQLGVALSLLFIMPRSPDLRGAGPVALLVAIALWVYGMGQHQPITNDLVDALRSVWLQIHVATAILSYGPLFLSGVTSVMASVMYKMGGEATSPRPALEDGGEPRPSKADLYEEWTYRVIAFGFPWLTALIVTGAVWANYAWGRAWGWDPKEMWSAITWLIYVAYLHMRMRRGWRGLPASLMATGALVAMVITFVGVSWITHVFNVKSLHAY
jgi:cytochrome c-type biogenesis protein CcsB